MSIKNASTAGSVANAPEAVNREVRMEGALVLHVYGKGNYVQWSENDTQQDMNTLYHGEPEVVTVALPKPVDVNDPNVVAATINKAAAEYREQAKAEALRELRAGLPASFTDALDIATAALEYGTIMTGEQKGSQGALAYAHLYVESYRAR